MDQDDLGNLIGMSQRNQTNQTLRKLEQQLRGVGGCPHCGGGLPRIGVSVCMHCQRELVWDGNVVGKPGQEAEIRRTRQRNQMAAQKEAVKQAKRAKIFAIAGACHLVWIIRCFLMTWGESWLDFFGQAMCLDLIFSWSGDSVFLTVLFGIPILVGSLGILHIPVALLNWAQEKGF
tara:strand:- start:618 stop:1145 length:528 start_codon:yes stop_codon:yes gene_type:complete